MSKTTKSAIDTLLRTHDAVGSQIEPLLSAIRIIEEDVGLKRLADEINGSREAMRAALGPYEGLRKAGLFNVNTQRR